MNLTKIISLIFLFFNTFAQPEWFKEIKRFELPANPIDVVICCHEKDKAIIKLCIQGVKNFVKGARRIIVISEKSYTTEAEWFDERKFPFSKRSIEKEFSLIDPLFKKDFNKIKRVGWYFKQLMNFYAAFVIPNISTNILILDADTVFLQPVEFLDEDQTMLHVTGVENYKAYFEHMERLLPGLKRVIEEHSGISHHMLFQTPILKDLFHLVESHHKLEFWKAYCRCVEPKEIAFSGAADYEIYFNFVLMRCGQIKIRPLKWKNITEISLLNKYKKEKYDFISWHSYSREDSLENA